MSTHEADSPIAYRRARFSTQLPADRYYTAGHYWIAPTDEDGRWKVGFTKFAVRMLGEMVEHGFEIEPGATIATGSIIGWLEGFKAVTDLYAVVDGSFLGPNNLITKDIDLVRRDPYGRGWLYEAGGVVDGARVDAAGYAAHLDTTIDRLLEGHAA